jgi:hypothetical protein
LRKWNFNIDRSTIINYTLINILFLLVFIHLPSIAIAQQKKILIKGVVVDKSDNNPIPFASIMLLDSKKGTISNNDGMFSLQVPKIPDSLHVSTVGYATVHIPINNTHQSFYKIELTPNETELSEVVIMPRENSANIIMKRVINSKNKNNPMKAKTIACNTYTKVLATAVSKKEGEINVERGLPIFFSEKFAQNYIQRNPFYEKEHIIAEKTTGLGLFNEFNILGLTSDLNIEYNFYENIIENFDKPFISPLSNSAFSYYKFFLRDTTEGDFGKEFIIEFVPKNLNDLVFKGYMKVIDKKWALSEISTSIPIDANLNYINKMDVFQTFIPVNDTLIFYNIHELTTELKITKDNSAIDINFTTVLNKRTIYSDVLLDIPPIKPGEEDSVLSELIPVPENIKTETQITQLRPEELSEKEEKAITVIDSVNNTWKIKTADAMSRMFLTGYIPGKNFDIGPYLELIKNNKIEGYRFTLSGRTSADFTKNTMYYGDIGYGLKDREWKYGIGLKHKFISPFRKVITFDYRNDLSRIGDNRSIFLIKENMMVTGEDNVIASFFTNAPLDKLSREISYRFEYEHEWRRGLTNIINFTHRTISSGLFLQFSQNGKPVDNFSTDELTFGVRLSWKESVTDNYCRRYYMSTQYPIVNFRLTGGRYHVGDLTNNYLITRAVLNHDINFGLTKFEYILEGGITFGNVPFPLLEIHRSNQSLGFALYSFNMMKEMEFASDRFLSVMAQYHLNGLFFNRVPLLKKSGIREVFSAKVLWSRLSEQHRQLLEFPSELSDASLPYVELSAGIENILQYFRVDAVFRLTNLDASKTIPIGIRARFDFNF